MEAIFYIFLLIIGTMFGSFASVVIYRLKNLKNGILFGRSYCPNCNKILKYFQLIPIFSWIFTKGKCFYCKNKISNIYPILELVTGIIFLLIGYFLIDFNLIISGNIIEIIKLFFWIFIGFVSIIYTFYDILFLEINEKIMFISIFTILIILSLQTIFPHFFIIQNLPIGIDNLSIGFYSIILSFFIIKILYIIMLKGLKEIYDIGLLIICILSLIIFKKYFSANLGQIPIFNGIIGALGIFIFFFLQIIISGGKWLGGGDLRIALIIGLIMGINLSFPGIMITYIFGSIIGILFIIIFKIKNGFNKKFNSQIPFGPFLALGFFTTILLQKQILNFIEIYFLNM